MEADKGLRAVWTRFHPLGYKVQELLFSGKLGKVKRFSADFSMCGDFERQSILPISPLSPYTHWCLLSVRNTVTDER